nr:MAG TPA: hypothetical protein [Caudoviricetes sp.]
MLNNAVYIISNVGVVIYKCINITSLPLTTFINKNLSFSSLRKHS